jgi:hypothetical protein
MKASSSFNMKKDIKRIIATHPADKRADFKNCMIQAQLAFEQSKRESARNKRTENNGE